MNYSIWESELYIVHSRPSSTPTDDSLLPSFHSLSSIVGWHCLKTLLILYIAFPMLNIDIEDRIALSMLIIKRESFNTCASLYNVANCWFTVDWRRDIRGHPSAFSSSWSCSISINLSSSFSFSIMFFVSSSFSNVWISLHNKPIFVIHSSTCSYCVLKPGRSSVLIFFFNYSLCSLDNCISRSE